MDLYYRVVQSRILVRCTNSYPSTLHQLVSSYVMLVSLYPCTLFACVRNPVRSICVLAYSSVSLYETFVCLPTSCLSWRLHLLGKRSSAFVSHCLFHVKHGDFNSWSYLLCRALSSCAYRGRLTVDASPLFLPLRSLDLAKRANRGLLLLSGLLC